MSAVSAPGAVRYGDGDIVLNDGRPTTQMLVVNTGDRAVQVGSHFHFFEVNPALRFDRRAAFGQRLDIPSGTAVRFEAGQAHTVTLVPFGGTQRIVGFQGFTNGSDMNSALSAAQAAGFDMGEPSA